MLNWGHRWVDPRSPCRAGAADKTSSRRAALFINDPKIDIDLQSQGPVTVSSKAP
jgi:hypothetical protein